MSGENESKKVSIVDALEAFNTKLDEFEVKNGVFDLAITDEAEEFATAKRDQLNKLTAEECSEGSFLLEQRAYAIQKTINRQLAIAKFCEMKIEALIALKVNDFKTKNFSSYQERRAVAIQPVNNEVAHKFEQHRIAATLKADRLSYLVARLCGMSNALRELSQVKRRTQNAA